MLSFVVASKPAKAGIDPYHKLIDRHYMDNVKAVAAGEAKGATVRYNTSTKVAFPVRIPKNGCHAEQARHDSRFWVSFNG